MSQIQFKIIPGAQGLYAPDTAGVLETLLFLLWTPDASQTTLKLEETWGEEAVGPWPGYYLSLNRLPSDLKSFENLIRSKLTAPAHSSFAWVQLSGDGGLQEVSVLSIIPGSSSPPTVAPPGYTMPTPTGFLGIAIEATTPVVPQTEGGLIQGFVVEYPPQSGPPPSAPPTGQGFTIPMIGEQTGCFFFQGLQSVQRNPPPNQNPVEKELYEVSIDPVRLFDAPTRTFQRPTGLLFELGEEGGLFYIRPR